VGAEELLFRCQASEAENARLMEVLSATEAQLQATKGELHRATAAAEHSVQGSLSTLEEIEELRMTAQQWQGRAVEGERWEARAREAEAEVKRLHAAHGMLSEELSGAELQRDEIQAMDASHRMQVAFLLRSSFHAFRAKMRDDRIVRM
jgi:crotonobetainyl-CoA:carnitine CoA-transferase CaiB-like acyl-CoA transferase